MAKANALEGRLDGFFETGSEGTYWAFERDPAPGEKTDSYDLLAFLEQGDRLEIFEDDGTLLWSGEIDKDTESNWYPYPGNPILGQQEAGGLWVHWLQRGVDPIQWAEMFFGHKRARLIQAGRPAVNGPRGQGYTDAKLPGMSDADLARVSPDLAHAMVRYLPGLDDAEMAGLFGVTPVEIAMWREHPEEYRMSRAVADRMAVLLKMFRALANLAWKNEERIAWLKRNNPAFGATPLAVLAAPGTTGIERVQAHLEVASKRARDTLGQEIVFRD